LKVKLRTKDERILEFEEIVKNREKLLAQTQDEKEEAQKVIDYMKVQITGRPILRGDNHLICNTIAWGIHFVYQYLIHS
jgi:hypothetical protein